MNFGWLEDTTVVSIELVLKDKPCCYTYILLDTAAHRYSGRTKFQRAPRVDDVVNIIYSCGKLH
jgi:hypothetical protein